MVGYSYAILLISLFEKVNMFNNFLDFITLLRYFTEHLSFVFRNVFIAFFTA
jgi:hypothetical protein